MARTQPAPTDWQEVQAKATAFLCLQQSGLQSPSMLEKANFLMRFGLTRPEAARLLGTTEGSLRVLAGRGGKRKTTRKKPTTKRKTTRKKPTTKSRAKTTGRARGSRQ